MNCLPFQRKDLVSSLSAQDSENDKKNGKQFREITPFVSEPLLLSSLGNLGQ